MLKYKPPSFWIVIAAAAVLIAGLFLLANPQTISFIDADGIMMLEMEQFNEGTGIGLVAVSDRELIEAVVSGLSGAKKTMRMTVNDYPTQNNYLVVRLIYENERRTMCLYSDGGGYYIEEPYVGVYKSSKDASNKIYEVYTVSFESIPAFLKYGAENFFTLLGYADSKITGQLITARFYIYILENCVLCHDL